MGNGHSLLTMLNLANEADGLKTLLRRGMTKPSDEDTEKEEMHRSV